MLTVLCGPANSGRTERLLMRYRTALAEQPLGAMLWIAPTWRAAAEVRLRLFDGSLPGCFSPNVMTFEKFAETVLRAAGLPMRPINRLMKRELIRQILAEHTSAGRLKHFQSIAATSGLADLVCEFISELKRLEIWPDSFRHACAHRGLTDKDVELFEIYESYQQALQEHNLFDAEGRFWSARDILQKAARSPEPQLTKIPRPSYLVVVDGFADFTRTQHEIIEILSAVSATSIVSLPLESEPCRCDLFAKSLDTLKELKRRHPGLLVENIARSPQPAWPSMSKLERRLFENPRNQAADPDATPASGIEILAAARQLGEIELIGATIKRLLVDGHAMPGDIAVVFRATQEINNLVSEVFERLGLPVAFEAGQTLDRSPALRALATLLSLDLEDWPFDQLLAVLGSNYFQPAWPEWRGGQLWSHAERAIRTVQIPKGRNRLLSQLQAEEVNGESHHTVLKVLHRLAKAFDALPDRATLPDWAKAWRQLARETGLLHVFAAGDRQQTDSSARHCMLSDQRAWNRFIEVLEAGDTLAAWLQRQPPLLNRREALDTLLDILHSESIGHAGDEEGYVRVLAASSVRSLKIPYLFLAGLSEKVFPPPDREDRLYSESEYVRLIEAGLPFVARTERTREEMLLFYEAITRATKRLYLSYPALDEAAQPLLPSPFLREVEQAFAPASLPRTERPNLSPVPLSDEPFSQAELRVKAMANAIKGDASLLGYLLTASKHDAAEQPSAAGLPSLPAGIEQIASRQERGRFGPYEGILPSKTAQHYLATLYSRRHVFSATELERYAACPFRFFMERVLKIEPLEDLELEFDVLLRGETVHGALAAFHQRVNEKLGRPGSPLELDPADYDTLLKASIEDALPKEPSNPVRAALAEVDRRLIVEWLSQYRVQCERYAELWKDLDKTMMPRLLEVSFGRDGQSAPSTVKPLEFGCDGEIVRISGRIDRIDTGELAGEVVFNIIDYKTGGTIPLSPESMRKGTALQLPLYSFAAMELFLVECDAIPWQAGYWYIRDNGFRPRQALKMYRNVDGRIELEPEWEEARSHLAETLTALVSGIRRGCFPVCNMDDRCTGQCEYKTVCRINQIRSLEKSWTPAVSE